jgi:hypothetical protein
MKPLMKGGLNQTTQIKMKYCNLIGILGLTAMLSSCSQTGMAGGPQSSNGKTLLTSSTHPSVPSTYKGEGKYVGRKYFNPPGTKGGLQWVSLYEKP